MVRPGVNWTAWTVYLISERLKTLKCPTWTGARGYTADSQLPCIYFLSAPSSLLSLNSWNTSGLSTSHVHLLLNTTEKARHRCIR